MGDRKAWLSALGISLALLIDAKGFLWVVPLGGCWILSLRGKQRWKGLFWSFLLLLSSFLLAKFTAPAQAPGLEEQLWWFYQERAGQEHPLPFRQAFPGHESFLWGHRVDFLSTVGWLWKTGGGGGRLSGLLLHWSMLLLALLLYSLIRWRKKWERTAFLLALSPFAVVMMSTMIHQPNWRRLVVGWIAAVLILIYALPRNGRLKVLLIGGLLLYISPIDRHILGFRSLTSVRCWRSIQPLPIG